MSDPIFASLRTIRLKDPLPCGVMRDGDFCGRDAYIVQASVYGDKSMGKRWLALPICKPCAAMLWSLYSGEQVTP